MFKSAADISFHDHPLNQAQPEEVSPVNSELLYSKKLPLFLNLHMEKLQVGDWDGQRGYSFLSRFSTSASLHYAFYC